MLALIKRRPGFSLQQFRDHYEKEHAPLVMQYLGPYFEIHRRNYTTQEVGVTKEQDLAGAVGKNAPASEG